MVEPSNETVTAKKDVEISFLRPIHEVPTYYVNVTSVRASNADVSMIMSQQFERSGTDLKAVPQTIVYMSHIHAKQLVILLQQTIETHEKHAAKAAQEPKEP